MNESAARTLINDAFEHAYDEQQVRRFVQNLLVEVDMKTGGHRSGQTYLGESVLVKTEQGGAQLLAEEGEVKNIFEGERFNGEGQRVAFALSGVSAATGKSQLTLEMAEEVAEGLVKRNSYASGALSFGSFISSAGAGNSKSSTYQTVNLVTNLGFAIGGAHSVGAVAGFGIDAIGWKKLAMENITLEILERQVDRTIKRQKRVEE
jgi:hypothetical protein